MLILKSSVGLMELRKSSRRHSHVRSGFHTRSIFLSNVLSRFNHGSTNSMQFWRITSPPSRTPINCGCSLSLGDSTLGTSCF
jgi:hypothetical protein